MTKLSFTRIPSVGEQPIESMSRGDVFEFGGDIFQRTGAIDSLQVYNLNLQKISDFPAGTMVAPVPEVEFRMKF